ncbi:hypothetical protein [Streptomyces sp. V4I2]|uniref:hypothetical protein n=1 Tax=Streptomyces sp. V4I2 TaxID=3042280 RepID=UPI002788D5E0|nr:hypothetical protein [Streptomyces sp. V4I2]MDQ1041833.1 hypothetical protein [Streptomyces sp. V4I2]
MNDKSEANAADSRARLNLPLLGTVERRWDTYQPFLKAVRVYKYKTEEEPEQEKVGFLMEEPPPKSTFGSDVSDPSSWDSPDDRGWNCPPGEPCTWLGPV